MAESIRPDASVVVPIKPAAQTGQTDAMVMDSGTQPQLTALPSSAATSRIDELANFKLPYTTKSYDETSFSATIISGCLE